MRILKSKLFSKWQKKERIKDIQLQQVVNEMNNGLVGVSLSNGLYKKRVARKGMGKRSAYRSIIAFRVSGRLIFLYGYAKNEVSNLSYVEEQVCKGLAKAYLNASDKMIEDLIKIKELIEVKIL